MLETIRFVKENLPETIIILGGPEVRYSAENFLRYGADYIVIGEGEETMTELVNALMLVPAGMENDFSEPSKHEPHHSIPGIAFLDGDNFVQNPERQKIKDLNDLSIPNRKKINLRPISRRLEKFSR